MLDPEVVSPQSSRRQPCFVPLSVGALLSSNTSLQRVTAAATELSADILEHGHDAGVDMITP